MGVADKGAQVTCSRNCTRGPPQPFARSRCTCPSATRASGTAALLPAAQPANNNPPSISSSNQQISDLFFNQYEGGKKKNQCWEGAVHARWRMLLNSSAAEHP
eukprot:TRINITY_DN985_c0_g5_i1.p1 TRINITY_DN985_c0_g5~~TRINITY_DN985_c0_g5_i1.p1  ORF type:complete len:103 (-),score=3.51 TRINITY_DN985_c0_g5_i1:420-728(-)